MDDIQTQTFIRRVKKTIYQYRMIDPRDSILVGVSGGSDSVALVYVLNGLKERLGLKLGVAHLNHALRNEASDEDEAFVKRLAKTLMLPFFSEKAEVRSFRCVEKRSLEDAARELRYRFFFNICDREGFQKIALGHTANDNAELVLMQLIRGSGLVGLGGMPAVRDRKIIRPLIHSQKAEIVSFLKGKGIGYVTDLSNEDIAFTRNRVRNILIPLIESRFNPNLVETLDRLSVILKGEEEWIQGEIAPVFDSLVNVRSGKRITLDLDRLSPLHRAVKRRVIRIAIDEVSGDLKGLGLIHVDSVIGILENKRAAASLDLPHGVKVTRAGAELIVEQKMAGQRGDALFEEENEKYAPFEYQIGEDVVTLGAFSIPERNATLTFLKTGMEKVPDFRYVSKEPVVVYLNADILRFPLCVRSIRPGDRFSPLGMTGTQKLKKYFINHKVPPEKRKRGFVVESGGKIVWVAGHRLDNVARVEPSTRNVLKIELRLA